jgi:glycosyltransferase involved in cell wall biosynthesis
MRILLLDQFSEPGGAQQMLLEFLPAVKARGWQAMLGLPGNGELFQRVAELGIEVQQIRCGPYTAGRKSGGDIGRFVVDTPVLARQIESLAERFRADLAYVNGPRLLPAAALAGLRIPVVFHSHSYLFPGSMRWLAGVSLRHSRAWVIASCEFVGTPLRPYVAPARVRVIYNGVAGPATGVQAPARKDSRLTIGCIGRIAPEKGQREFVQVARVITRSLPGCRFVVYGAALFADAAVRKYAAEVERDGAENGVEFAGWAGDVYAAMRNLDLLLVPSAGHEATTRVILEAHAAGLPVIAFRSGGIPEVVRHGFDGWLVQSAEEMAQLAVELLGDPRRLRAAAENARESWRTRFRLDRFQENLLEAVEGIARAEG